MAMATPIHDPDQGDYRLVQECGADRVSAENVAVSYRLDGGARPIERIGAGWSEFGLTAGSVLESGEDVEGMRRLLAGRDPGGQDQLVKPKLAVAPEAQLPAAPFVAALETAAATRGVSVEGLVAADPWSIKRVGRLERGLKRDGEHHRAPVADLSRVAAAAGIDPRRVYGRPVWKKAWDQREARVRTGVMGYDVTFDRPKGISVLQGLAPQEVAARMEEIHLQAVREAVSALEGWVGYAMAGHHGDGQSAKRVDTSGLVGTMTVHRTARPVDGQPGDPHLHTHVLLANMARGSDGTWRTIAAGGRDLMRHVPAVGELYRALEREKLTRELGVRFERDPATGRWDVVGVPASLKTTFSRRQAQVLATAGEHATPAQGRTAARVTARAKVASTPTSERASWHERALAAGHDPGQVVANALGRDPGPPAPGRTPGGPDQGPPNLEALVAAVWDPERGVTAHTKTVTRAKVMAHVAGALQGGLPDAAALEALTDHVLDHEQAVALSEAGPAHMSHADRYTSADIVAAEERITVSVRRRRHDFSAHVHLKTIIRSRRAWEKKKGFRLSAEQRKVVHRLTFVPHGIDTVVGVAGAGKTTIMSAARAIWESAGYRVEGAANAAVAAAGLRAEAGIDSGTVASLLRRIEDGPGLQGVHVLVLDEAATIDDRALAAIVDEAARTRTKLVGIGDPLQARAVGAGGAFARVHEIVQGQTLTENRRQKGEVDRKALEAWRAGARRSALALWGSNGMVHTGADADAAHQQITAAWAADRARYTDAHQAIERLAVLAATNADVEALNTRIRAAARTAGHLAEKDVSFRLAGGRTLELAAGDQVRVRANDYRSRRGQGPDVLNGFRGLVLEADQRRGAHIEWSQQGRTERAWIDPDALSRGALSHGYATTVASAQGMTVDRAHVYGLGADAHDLYPAMSRSRERVDLYLPACVEPETVRTQLGQARTQEEALHRTLTAYANTLTDSPEGMVSDELAGGRQVREERERAVAQRAQEAEHAARSVAPWEPLTLAEANAGRGPATRQAAPQIAQLNERQAVVEQALPELIQRAQEAEARADKNRLGLLLEGTTRAEAQAQRDAAREEVERAAAEREQLRAQAQQVRAQALVADRFQVQADHERQRRETLVAHLEQRGPVQGLTRQDLRGMDERELAHVRTRQALQACAPGPARTHQDRVQVPTAPPEPSRSDQVAEMTRAGDAAEYQQRIIREIEEEDLERRHRAQLDADLRRQQLEAQQREYAERAQREAAQRSGPELSL
ncbi:MobF family relaxase [Nocardiopsis sp. JB363]|uniref:MobF family relaxase n=1 Tax=Nocardiopsis sp. JB363 TaxID=1434837 RepID=UPI00097A8F06|nr:MobF family relaxase [Nocardiopsis sp. JB363]SIO86145.1 Conjugal transfer protein TraA [Nocardiopsis sp. JB363]